jgi:hypothetical protein
MPGHEIALVGVRGVETVSCTSHRTRATRGLAASGTIRHIKKNPVVDKSDYNLQKVTKVEKLRFWAVGLLVIKIMNVSEQEAAFVCTIQQFRTPKMFTNPDDFIA